MKIVEKETGEINFEVEEEIKDDNGWIPIKKKKMKVKAVSIASKQVKFDRTDPMIRHLTGKTVETYEPKEEAKGHSLISYCTPAPKQKKTSRVFSRNTFTPEAIQFNLSSDDDEEEGETETPNRNRFVQNILATPSIGRTKRITTPPPPNGRQPLV